MRNDGGFDVGGDAAAAGAEQGIHLVEKHNDRIAVRRSLLGFLEHLPDLSFGLADILVQQLRALYMEEKAANLFSGEMAEFLRNRIGDRLGNQRLPATGWAIQQDAFGWAELVLCKELWVEEWQLHCVADLLDLLRQPPDVVIADIGYLFEYQLFRL